MRIIFNPILSILFFSLMACSTSQKPQANIEPFLATVHEFKQSAISPDFYLIDPATTITTKYNNIIVDSPYVSIKKTSKERYVKPDVLKFVGDLFLRQVKLTLNQDFEITNIPSPDTLRLRLVLINLSLPSHQQAIVSSNAGFVPIGLNDSIIEAYAEDSLTGDLISGIRDFRFGKQKNQQFLKGFTSIEYFRHVFAAWSGELRAILDETLPKSKKKEAAEKNKTAPAETLLYATPEQPRLDSLPESSPTQSMNTEDIIEYSEGSVSAGVTDTPQLLSDAQDSAANP